MNNTTQPTFLAAAHANETLQEVVEKTSGMKGHNPPFVRHNNIL
ncbi:hypothetical protein Z949_3758 [Sulfitobacter guttiformis KCTC 32187]|nr:hypothetical protein Z949_3758 [Sulfitobacter guttiformis KCTC 32187]